MAFLAIDSRPREIMLQRSNTRINWLLVIAMAINLGAWCGLAAILN